VEPSRRDGAGHRREQGDRARHRGGAGTVRRARAHVLPQRGGAGGVPPPVGREGPAGHRLRLRRRRARRQGEAHGHGQGHLRWQARYPRELQAETHRRTADHHYNDDRRAWTAMTGEQRGADGGQAGGGVHGGGLLRAHGDQPGVVLPPQPARAPSPPELRHRQRGKHRAHLLHCKLPGLSRVRDLQHGQRYEYMQIFF